MRNFLLSSSTKNIPVQTAQLTGKIFTFPSLQKGNLLAFILPCVDHSSLSQLANSDSVFWSLFIPTTYYGWQSTMLLAICNAFILRIAMNHRWCHANSLYCNCKIEIRLPVGGKVAGSSILFSLLSFDSKMAPPGQLLQAVRVLCLLCSYRLSAKPHLNYSFEWNSI